MPRSLRWSPALALLLLAAVVLISGSGGWAALLIAVDAGFVWVFGAGAEAAAGRVWLIVALLLGAAGGVAIAIASGATGLGPLGAGAATGAALEAIAVQLTRCRGVAHHEPGPDPGVRRVRRGSGGDLGPDLGSPGDRAGRPRSVRRLTCGRSC